jgi:hypothetical protein
MRGLKFASIAVLLLTASAVGQAEPSTASQETTNRQPASEQPANQQPAAQPPATPRPAPQSVAAAARASRQAQQSAPATKVYRNKDVKDRDDVGGPAATGSSAASAAAGSPASVPTTSHSSPQSVTPPVVTQSDAAQIQKDRAFEAQAEVFKSQMLAEKGKVVRIQNRIADLKYQFDAWSTEYAQDPTDAQACWTSTYYTPYYKEWCDTGRKLKAQYDASQRQLAEEKGRLDQMQENIRRQGYGNAVYDPD